MRIVSDELWARVKERQLTTAENFSRTTTNQLNKNTPAELYAERSPRMRRMRWLLCDHGKGSLWLL